MFLHPDHPNVKRPYKTVLFSKIQVKVCCLPASIFSKWLRSLEWISRLTIIFSACRKGAHFVKFLKRLIEYIKVRMRVQHVMQESPAGFLNDIANKVRVHAHPACKDIANKVRVSMRRKAWRTRGLNGVKGSVSRDFRPPVFFMNRTHLGPW